MHIRNWWCRPVPSIANDYHSSTTTPCFGWKLSGRWECCVYSSLLLRPKRKHVQHVHQILLMAGRRRREHHRSSAVTYSVNSGDDKGRMPLKRGKWASLVTVCILILAALLYALPGAPHKPVLLMWDFV